MQILSGSLRPGERLLEAKLSKELGVSQATVNAALQELHDQTVVTKLLNAPLAAAAIPWRTSRSYSG